jgi:hypothetical protein
MMIAGRPIFTRLLDIPFPDPPLQADLNAVFLLAIAAGYTIPYRDPDSRGGRVYLGVMGPLLKGGGALTFVFDYLVRHSPRSVLLFAMSDAGMAALALWALVATRRAAHAPAISRAAGA